MTSDGTPAKPSPLLWLGKNTPLLDALSTWSDIYHVHTAQALLRALHHYLAPCVILDLSSRADHDFAALVKEIRRQWPHIGLLALVPPAANSAAIGKPYPELDYVVSAGSDPLHLRTTIADMMRLVERRLTESNPPQVENYDVLPGRLRQLEELAQAGTSLLAQIAGETDVLGDLRKVARVAVDADDIAILIATDDYSDLHDALHIGVPEKYLELCRRMLTALPPDKRLSFLGDEVLLRELLPGMSARVHEAEAAGAASYMRLPLTVENQLIGFVALFASTPRRFDGAHLQLGRLFAAQVATAVRNMRFYLRLNRAEQRQEAVSRVARLVAENLDLTAVLARIVEEAVQLVRGSDGAVTLIEPDGSLVIRAAYGAMTPHIGKHLPLDRSIAGLVLRSGEPSIIKDYARWDGAVEEMREGLLANALLYGVPLKYQGRVVGILQVVTTTSTPSDIQEELEVLMALAPQAAIAIVKAQLHAMILQEQQQLKAIVDNTSAVVAAFDADGTILLLNRMAQQVLEQLGIPLDAVQGKRLADLLQPLLPDQSLDLASLGSMLEVNLGDVGEYLVQLAPITNAEGAVYRYVGVAHDVSTLRKLDRMKSDLIHILSHDLRNPLGLARGSIDLLDEPDLPPDQRTQLKEMVIVSLDRMDQLIKDVVDLEVAQSLGEETALPYQISPLVQKVVKSNQPKAERQNITLVYNEINAPTQRMKGHGVMIGQAIDNLVNNAIKYTPPGGRVEVTLDVEGEYAVVRVKDTGYGIDAEHLPRLFHQFYRVPDKRTRHIQGSGLGLSLVRTIAEAHGGRVSVESQVDVGSTFTFALPINPVLEAKPAEPFKRFDFAEQVNKRLS